MFSRDTLTLMFQKESNTQAEHYSTWTCSLNNVEPKQNLLVGDLSLCVLSDDEDELLIERKSCDECDFIALTEEDLENHNEYHVKKTSCTLQEGVTTAPPVVKPPPLYKCNACSFTTTTTGELKDHMKDVHEKEKLNVLNESVFLHTCISSFV